MKPVLRGTAIWLLTSAATVVAPWAVRPELALLTRPDPDLVGLLRGLAAVSVLGCLVWWWAASTAVLVQAFRGRTARPPGCPRWLHRLLLATLGLTLAVGLAEPAVADGAHAPVAPERPAIGGLPFPDRATTPVHRAAPRIPQQAPSRRHLVRPGDTLWALAERDLAPTAPAAAIQARWQETYRLNREVIGPDPDLLIPGTPLELPPPVREETR